MLQPVGGMDRIAYAIYDQVRPNVRLGEPIMAIRREGSRVRINIEVGVTCADFCVCALPGNQVSRIANDFSPAKRTALQNMEYLKSAKIAFEAPRFWENDGVYGGLAWTDKLNENAPYPSSSGFHSERGVLVAAYCAGWTHPNTPDAFTALPFDEQVRISRRIRGGAPPRQIGADGRSGRGELGPGPVFGRSGSDRARFRRRAQGDAARRSLCRAAASGGADRLRGRASVLHWPVAGERRRHPRRKRSSWSRRWPRNGMRLTLVER